MGRYGSFTAPDNAGLLTSRNGAAFAVVFLTAGVRAEPRVLAFLSEHFPTLPALVLPQVPVLQVPDEPLTFLAPLVAPFVLQYFTTFGGTGSGTVAVPLDFVVNRSGADFARLPCPDRQSANATVWTAEKLISLILILDAGSAQIMTGPVKTPLSNGPGRPLFDHPEPDPAIPYGFSGRHLTLTFEAVHDLSDSRA